VASIPLPKIMVENWKNGGKSSLFYGEIIDPVAKIEQFAMRQVFEYLQLMMRVRLTCPPFISDTLPISLTFEFGSRKGSHLCTVGEPP